MAVMMALQLVAQWVEMMVGQKDKRKEFHLVVVLVAWLVHLMEWMMVDEMAEKMDGRWVEYSVVEMDETMDMLMVDLTVLLMAVKMVEMWVAMWAQMLVELTVDQLVDMQEYKMDILMVGWMVDQKELKEVGYLDLNMAVTKETWKGKLLAVLMVGLQVSEQAGQMVVMMVDMMVEKQAVSMAAQTVV